MSSLLKAHRFISGYPVVVRRRDAVRLREWGAAFELAHYGLDQLEMAGRDHRGLDRCGVGSAKESIQPFARGIDSLRCVRADFCKLGARSFGKLKFLTREMARENSQSLAKFLLRPALRVRQIPRRGERGIVGVDSPLLIAGQ